MRTLAGELAGFSTFTFQLPSLANYLRKSDVVGDLAHFERSVQLIQDPPQLSDSYADVMAAFRKALRNAMHSQLNSHKPPPPPSANFDGLESEANGDLEAVTQLWDTCSYTLQALEIYLFEVQKPLKAELPMRHQSCATNLVRACALSSTVTSGTQVSVARNQAEWAARFLDTVFNQKGPSVLEWDCFRMLVQFQFGVLSLMAVEKGE